MKKIRLFKSSEKQIYIVPNIWGAACFFGTVLVFITGFVFGNSTLYLFGFALTTFFVTGMVQSNNNLRGLFVSCVELEPAFAGDQVSCLMTVRNEVGIARHNLRVRIVQGPKQKQSFQLEECSPLQSIYERAFVETKKRGIFSLPRVQISSQYPLGLFFTWKVHRSHLSYAVYPRPEGLLPLPEIFSDAGSTDLSVRFAKGTDEFSGLHVYTAADPPGRIAWSTLARGMPLAAKSFEAGEQNYRVLDFEGISFEGVEERLSQLAAWIVLCDQRSEGFELRLPTRMLGPGFGPEFSRICLTELAGFGTPPLGNERKA